MKSKSEEEILKRKKAIFLGTVRRTIKEFNLPDTEVFFGDCPHRRKNELAHFHPIERLICVSDEQLGKMSFDDVEETATHEVNHLLDTRDESNPVHSPGFYIRHDEMKTKMWHPPAGTVFIDGSKSKRTSTPKQEESEPDTERCNYHLCRKKVALTRCPYCGGYYCDEHSTPKRPWLANLNSLDPTDILQRQEFGGHPCPDFVDYKMKEEENAKKIYQTALKNKVSEIRHIKEVIIEEPEEDERPSKVVQPAKTKKKSEKKHKGECNLRVLVKSRFLGKKRKNIEVVLTQNNQYFSREHTNQAGVAVFYWLKDGDYEVTASLKGKTKTKKISVSGQVAEVTLRL